MPTNPFLPNNQPQVKPIRDTFINKENLNSISFDFAAADSQICDLGAYVHNQLLQLNSGSVTVEVSCDGINFYAGPSASVGINEMSSTGVGYRYIQVTSSGAAQGLVFGALY
jgi:hypothetical protein